MSERSETANSALAVMPPSREWLGFPRGAWLIVGVEFWERFSFYAMMGVLALFLTGNPARGGFGWPDQKALALVGLYSGLMYALPAFGGYVADRVLGRRRAITCGLLLMLSGQILMVSPFFVPALLGALHGVDVTSALREIGQPLGLLLRTSDVDVALAAQGARLDAANGQAWLTLAYFGSALGFYAAIACMVCGNALMKSTLVVLCGESFRLDDPRRDGAYAYYYLGICLGGVISGLVIGVIADSYGWAAAFSIAVFGVGLAFIAYATFARELLGSIGVAREPTAPAGGRATSDRHDRARQNSDRIMLIFVLALLLLVFSASWFQLYGTWILFIEREVDRSLGGMTVPVPWFASWNPAVVIVFAPLVAVLTDQLAKRGRAPDIVQKYCLSLTLIVAAHLLMYLGSRWSAGEASAPLWLPALAIALTAIGELIAWTSTYGLVTRAAPEGYASATMGAWYFMTLGLGGYFAGFAGLGLDALGYGGVFLAIAAAVACVAVASLLLRAPLRRLAARAGVSL